MSTGSHHLPLPAGARVAPATRRARTRWAAPDPAALVLDPWAAPVGVPIASAGEASWAAPSANARIRWMPAPAALMPAPAGVVRAPLPAPTSDVTDRALATLRAISAAPTDVERLTEVRWPAPTPLPTIATFDPPDPAARVVADAVDAEPVDTPTVRWRVIALITAAGASVAAAVTLLSALL